MRAFQVAILGGQLILTIAGSIRIKNRNKGTAMKKTILGTSVILATLNLFAQGTVLFSSISSLGTSHVWGTIPGDGMVLIGADGTGGRYGAATTFAQLLAANGPNQPESSLVAMGQTTTFKTGVSAGRLAVITDTLEGIPADSSAATLEVVAWDNSSGLYPTWTQASAVYWAGGYLAVGRSGPFTVLSIGGSVNTPPPTPFPSFNLWLLPEPSTITLAVLGGAMLMIRRRRK